MLIYKNICILLVSVGSNTLRIVMERWREAFQQLHSGIEISISSKGSATAPPALTEGSSTLAPMSRELHLPTILG